MFLLSPRQLLVILVLCMGIASGRGGGVENEPDPLAGEWSLTSLVIDGGQRELSSPAVTVVDFSRGGRIHGRAPVNTYDGEFRTSATGEFKIVTPLRVTRRGGPAELLRLESAYLSALAAAARWEIKAGGPRQLRLSSADAKTVLTFSQQR